MERKLPSGLKQCELAIKSKWMSLAKRGSCCYEDCEILLKRTEAVSNPDLSLWRCPLGGGFRGYQEHIGGIKYPIWPGNTLKSIRRSYGQEEGSLDYFVSFTVSATKN